MTASELDLDAIDARSIDWRAGVTACPTFGNPCNTCHQRAEDLAEVVPALVAEVRRLRADLASREPQVLTDEPGPEVTEVYDRDGHSWERNKAGLWCAFGADIGVPTSWVSLARVWGPITVKAAGR